MYISNQQGEVETSYGENRRVPLSNYHPDDGDDNDELKHGTS